jgi:hypothetical protein
MGLGYHSGMNEVTRIQSAIGARNPQAAAQLLPLVYDELRRLAGGYMAMVTFLHANALDLPFADERCRPSAKRSQRRSGSTSSWDRSSPRWLRTSGETCWKAESGWFRRS